MPVISVIVPVYKVEPYLRRCVDSILAQTFTDFELILVDDGSPDNCGSICDEYAQKDPRVVVIHQQNGGLSAARNAGIDWAFANSDSQWLSFVDSDDWVHPEYLERLLKAAVENGVSVSICGYAGTAGEEPEVRDTDMIPVLWKPEDFYVAHNTNATIACGKLYRKDCFREIRYPVGKIHEDEFTTYKILFGTDIVAFIQAPFYAYFQNPNSIVRSKWSEKRLDVLDALEERISFFKINENLKMVSYCETQLQSRTALLYLQAYANRKSKLFPKKYNLNFFKALHILEETCGTDRYESLLVHDYPMLIKIQAYGRRIIQMLDIKPKDLLSVVSIAKYEAPYIKEWVEYHLLQGVDRIYLYDNESPDNMCEILEPYIQSGRVVYTLIPGRARQLDAYNDAVRRFKFKTKYMAFIDCDEFLVVEQGNRSLAETVDSIIRANWRCAGLAVNWRMYGSSGYEKKPDGLVTENFLYRGDGNSKGSDCIKTVANPRLIKEYCHVHYPTYYRGLYSVNENGQRVDGWSNPCGNTKKIRINHYFTKSKQEWIERRSRGKADTTDQEDKRSLQEFEQHDHNEIYDPIMLPYVDNLKKKV